MSFIERGFAPHFLDVIGTWAASIPIQSFWAIIISVPVTLGNTIQQLQSKKYDGISWADFEIDAFNFMTTNDMYNTASSGEGGKFMYGCAFARSIGIPGERVEMTNPGLPQTGGLIFPDIVQKRAANNSLNIQFLETNVSYVDVVLRPWSIAASYLGLVPRVNQNIKGNIQAIFYAKGNDYPPPAKPNERLATTLPLNPVLYRRKSFYFENIVPTDINIQEYSQRGDSLVERPCKFYFSRYSVSTGDVDDSLLYRGH